MSLDNNQVKIDSLGALVIDPNAEPGTKSVSKTAAQQEEKFYTDSGRQYGLLHNQQNLGYLGKLFGANSSAPTNIAGFVIVCSLLILLVSLFFQTNPDIVESRKWLISLITSALSFIFGASSKH